MSSNIRISKNCEFCGTEYIAKTTKTRYCSHTCNSRAYKANLKKKKVEGTTKEVKTNRNSKELEVLTYKDFLNVRETALLLGCSTRTVYRLIQDGSIKAVNLSQCLIRINKKSLNSLIPQA